MLKRFVALIILALLPVAPVLALSDGTTQAAPYSVPGAVLDQVTKTYSPAKPNRDATLLGYTMSFHDNQYQYAVPVCADASLVELNGHPIDPSAFIAGDTLVISVRTNTSAAKTCINRVVRQTISRGSSGGECLQDFQVKEEIEGTPSSLLIKTPYVYLLTIYNRPTVDCDGKAFGADPIVTNVAAGKPFIVTLQRATSTSKVELTRWSINTDVAGRASLSYSFSNAADYKFQIIPGTTAVAGDVISWSSHVTDPHPTPSPAASASTKSPVAAAPLIILLLLVLGAAGGAEYWHWVKKKRVHESPEREYERTPKL